MTDLKWCWGFGYTDFNGTVLIIYSAQDKEEPGLIEQLKTQICDNLTLYAQKYDEEFASSVPIFVNDVWQLLINTGVEVKYDLVMLLF